MSYLPIGEYGVIGDLHTAALVGRNGSIDWLCVPRFDSPSVFAALLDDTIGGRCRIAPVERWTSEQRYLPATNILETSFHVEGGGVVELQDLMPAGPARVRRSEILRRLTCVRGTVELEVEFAPRFDYGARDATLHRRRHGVLATDDEDDVAAIAATPDVDWQIDAGRAAARVRLAAGETRWILLSFDDDEVRPLDAETAQQRLEATARFWDGWSAKLTYRGPYRAEVERSALALKLCCYEPTGAIIGAPTTSLPEAQGGGRNWDYRYAWLRDSAFVLFALDRVGSDEEVEGFVHFLKRVCRRTDGRHVQIMFGIDGQRDLPERSLDHLEGYRESRPVRVGNGAAGQFQLDVYGELLVTFSAAQSHHGATEGLWKVLRGLVDWTAEHWREPDFSIWEARDVPKQYVFSKVLAWAALDRGVTFARSAGMDELAARWRAEADALRAEVLVRGWDESRRTFVQAYDEPQLDGALLIIPKIGFLPRTDPRIASTLDAVRRELASPCEELIYRYRSPDGLADGEGAFVACSFWMVQNLAMTGAFEEAERLFRNLLRRANHLGLLAEQIDPATGEQLGNFPQALSHAALLNTACILEQLRPGRAPAPAEPSGGGGVYKR